MLQLKGVFQSLRSVVAKVIDPTPAQQIQALEENIASLYRSARDGPFVMTPDQLAVSLEEAGYNRDILLDVLSNMRDEYAGGDGSWDVAAKHSRALNQSRRLWMGNPLYQWAVWLWTAYGFGAEPVIKPKNKALKKVWDEFILENQAIFSVDRIQELSHWTLVDGELYLVLYGNDKTGECKVSLAEPTEMEPIYHPLDRSTVVAYRYTQVDGTELYYPDWRAFFQGVLDGPVGDGTSKTVAQALDISDEQRADKKWTKTRVHPVKEATTTEGQHLLEFGSRLFRERDSLPGTVAVVLHVAWNRKSKATARGWPLSTVSASWTWSHRQFMSDRLTVSAAKASLVRRVITKGGSRAVRAVANSIASNLSAYSHIDSNPPGPAGQTFVHNEAVDGFDDLAMRTGAGDAKTDEEMFAWMALIGMGVYPHYAGKEGVYRLATAKTMEKPTEAVYYQYRIFWAAQFRALLEVVSLFAKWYGGAKFSTLKADVSIDSMTTVDLLNAAPGIATLFRDILIPLADAGRIPAEAVTEAAEHVFDMAMDALGGQVPQPLHDAFKEVAELVKAKRSEGEAPEGEGEAPEGEAPEPNPKAKA